MMDDKTALQLARDAEKGSTSYFDANIRPNLERDIRQFNSRHNPDSKYMSDAYKSRARFYRPKTRSMVRNGEATAAEAFFSTADVVDITAEDERDEAQQVSAEVMLELLNYRLKKTIPWFQTCIGAYQDAMVQGTVISHQAWEYDEAKGIDQPVITLIPLENFRFDPGADWIDPVGTSPYLIRLMPMYVRDIKRRMRPGADGTPAKWNTLSDGQMLSAARKYDSTRMLREDNRMNSADAVTAITDFTIVWVHMVIMADEDTGEDVMYYTLGTEFLLSSPVPLTEQYAHGKRPFVIGKAVIETHKNWSAGPVRLARDTIAEINEISNQRVDNVKLAMNKRYFVKRNKQVDIRSITRNVAGSVTLMDDPELDVKVVSTPDVTSSSYQEQDRLNMDFDEVTGSMSQSSVQANRKLNETVGGMEMMDAGANKVQALQLKTFIETWVEPALYQLILLEQFYETDENLIRLASSKSKGFQKAGMNEVTDEMLMAAMTMTVSVGMNATSPSQKINNLMTGIRGVKEALADGTLEKYGVDPVEVIKEVFGALGHKDGGRFFANVENQDPQVQSLQQQVQQLQQALDAKHPPELLAAMVKELEAKVSYINKQGDKVDADKVATGVTSAYAAMQAAEVIASVPQVAPIADKIMQAAGYQVPSPTGVDPNFPETAQMAGGLAASPLAPAAAEAMQSGPVDIGPSSNSSPMFPGKSAMPASPMAGAKDGIETQRADGMQPGVTGA